MENKICQSCGMPIISNEQLGKKVAIILIVFAKIQNVIAEKNE